MDLYEYFPFASITKTPLVLSVLTVCLFFALQFIAETANIITKLSQLGAKLNQTTLCRLQLSR